jgi:hypothetical protein
LTGGGNLSADRTIAIDSTVATLTGTQTLTNKTINLASNTLQATSAEIAAAVTDETGSGALVFANSPTLVTPALGTPSALVGTNITGTAAGLTAGNVTTNANLTGAVTSTGNATLLGSFSSANLAGALTDETGTGSAVFANSPTLVTPALGTPASGVVTNLTGTASININGTVGATTASTGAFTTLTTSSDVTLSGGTANGVAYLNGSKVLTTGSALTFDGTNFNVVRAAATDQYMSLYADGTGPTLKFFGGAAGKIAGIVADAASASMYFTNEGNKPFVYAINGSEQMRLTSTGLGIGTSSPVRKIHAFIATGPVARFQTSGSNAATEYVPGATDGSGSIFNWIIGAQYNLGNAFEITPSTAAGGLTFSTPAFVVQSGGNVGIGTSSPSYKLTINTPDEDHIRLENGSELGIIRLLDSGILDIWNHGDTANEITFRNGAGTGTERMRLDASGNLGLGVTPSAWSTYKAFQFGAQGSIASASNATYLGNNWFTDGTNKYIQSGTAGLAGWEGNLFKWYQAPSGTAGDAISFTQAMTLDASGNLGVGATSPSTGGRFVVYGKVSYAGQNQVALFYSQAAGGAVINFQDTASANGSAVGGTGDNLTFYTSSGGGNLTERARIDSSGNLLVGTTSGSDKIVVVQSAVASASQFKNASGTDTAQCVVAWHANTTGDNVFHQFFTEASATLRGSITYNRAGGLVAYNTTSDYRAKDISGPVVGSGALIDSVPVYMGKMKGATQERPMFIAHEVPAYAHTGEKDAVDAEGNPVYQQMDASALIPVMWAEIQSLRQRLAAAGI